MIRMVQITPEPEAKKGETGTISLYGEIVPVYSMRELIGFEGRPPLPSDNLIIVKKGLEIVALWVDDTYIVQPGDLASDERHTSEHLQAMIPGTRIIRSDLLIFSDIAEFLEHGACTGTRFVDIFHKESEEEIFPEDEVRDYPWNEHILKERANQLASPKKLTEKPPVIEVIRFNLMYQEYALEMEHIREVIQTAEITPVPGTPDFIAGICIVRGEVISLVDIRALLSLPEKGLPDMNRVIVLTDGNLTFGILADQISGIGFIRTDEIVNTKQPENPDWQHIISGTIDSMYVLNSHSLLTDPRMVIDDTEY